MVGLFGFIVHVDKHIEDEIQMGSITLKIDSQINHTRNAITKGTIVGLPKGYSNDDIEVGCEIVFDPKVTAQQNRKGVFHKSKFLIDEKEKLYFIPYSEYINFVFAIKGVSGEWINMSNHDILEPIEVPLYSKDEFGMLLKNPSYENMKEGMAKMVMPTMESESLGFEKDKICYFKKGIEWLIELDEKKYYAIRNRYVFTTKEILNDLR